MARDLRLGLNLGYEWGRISNNPTRPAGAVAGIQGGYNWQFNQFVLGGEADIQITGADDVFALRLELTGFRVRRQGGGRLHAGKRSGKKRHHGLLMRISWDFVRTIRPRPAENRLILLFRRRAAH